MDDPKSNILEHKLKYTFKDPTLLLIVLTRRAAILEGIAHPIKHTTTFSGLKFLGTRVLRLLISHFLFSTALYTSEEELTDAHKDILSHNGMVISAAKDIMLENALILGRGEALNAIHQNAKVLFEHMQALFGALWMDSNASYVTVTEVFNRVFNLEKPIALLSPVIELPEGLLRTSSLEYLEGAFGYNFKNRSWLLNALTRKSALEENIISATTCFQKLEFLGDKVLGCIVAEWLSNKFPSMESDFLNPLFDEIVCNATVLPHAAIQLNIGKCLIIGEGEEKIGLRTNSRRLADHMEALIGAMWADSEQDYLKIKACLVGMLKVEFEKKLPQASTTKLIADPFPALPNRPIQNVTAPVKKTPPKKSYKAALDSKSSAMIWALPKPSSAVKPEKLNLNDSTQFPALSKK